GLILEEYGRVKGTDWGFPTSDAYGMPVRNDADPQFFWDYYTTTGTLIIWTQMFGAHATERPIMEKYLALGAGNGSGGYGVPISSIYSLPDVGQAQDFLWGPTKQVRESTIVTSPNTGTHDVAGRIRHRWLANGLGLGAPTADSTVHLASGNR